MSNDPRKITIIKKKSVFNDPKMEFIVSENKNDNIDHILSVTARVTDLEKWKETPGVTHHTDIEMDKDKNGDTWYLVTGRILSSEAENIQSKDYVKTLSISGKIFPLTK